MNTGDTMRFLAAALLAVLFAFPATAHHVDVATVGTDAEAFATFQAEYTAQRDPMFEDFLVYINAPSGAETLSALNILETDLTVSIDHLASLDVRECFALWAEVARSEFDEVADQVLVLSDGGGAEWVEADSIRSLILNETFVDLFHCDGEMTA